MSGTAIPFPLTGAPCPGVALPQAATLDSLSFLLRVFLPTFTKGIIIRRPWMLAVAETFDLDRRAVTSMQALRTEYGYGPLRLRIPGRQFVLVLDAEDVHRILAESPQPFSTGTPEKTGALAHFEPKGSLISHGAARAERRQFNEAVLEPDRPVHELAEPFTEVVRDEILGLLTRTAAAGSALGWRPFSDAWFRIVRRVIFGDAAANDHQLSRVMAALRRRANWAYLLPQQPQRREELFSLIRAYLRQAAPGSLAGLISRIPKTAQTAPEQQVPQWLFAFDAAGMTTFRALALLASRAPASADFRDAAFLRATVLETLRLWPTSPLILRQSTTLTKFRNGELAPESQLIIYSPFFHRDDQRLPFANSFAPEIWLSDQAETRTRALIPFSEGPGMCPGRQLVMLLTTATLSQLLAARPVRLTNPYRLPPHRPLPGTLNHFTLRFRFGA